MYDPLAIVRELGEAVDSPNVVETTKDEGPMVEPPPILPQLRELSGLKLSVDLILTISKVRSMQIYIVVG